MVFLLSGQGSQHLPGKQDVTVGSAAAAIFAFQHFQQGFHVGSRGMRFLVIKLGPGLDIIPLGLESPESGFLDDPELAFDSILIPDGPFMVPSHGVAEVSVNSVNCGSIDMA